MAKLTTQEHFEFLATRIKSFINSIFTPFMNITKEALQNLATTLQSHMDNEEIHITNDERIAWNEKTKITFTVNNDTLEISDQ